MRTGKTAIARESHRCFSRSGWWQTLCGRDAANQGFGWVSNPELVGCLDCKKRIRSGEHTRRGLKDILSRQEAGR